ncbi:hypothetical protein RJ55_01288 [Drechmeria coniospora]|nr:hypothetical protein RJ55_01288 [Drechmeria coniospora]
MTDSPVDGGCAEKAADVHPGDSTRGSDIMTSATGGDAENAGIKLDEEGFAPLDKVLSWGPLRSLNVSLSEVQSVVASNEKQRFALKPKPRPDSQAASHSLSTSTSPPSSTESNSASDYLIRANQGHSIKLESASVLQPVTLDDVPPRVLHGTYYAFWPSIVAAGGLKPMGRTHVHCSTGTPEEGVVSGMRRDAELVIEIDVQGSLRAGVTWWRSDNGVLLTEGGQDGLLSTTFFKKVTGRAADVAVLWENGEKVADLPPGIQGKILHGKGHGKGPHMKIIHD